MPRYHESDAPEDFKAAIQTLEGRADKWFATLALSKRPWNCAVWSTLTKVIETLERVVKPNMYGGPEHKAVLLNLGRAAPLVIDHIRRFPVASGKLSFRLDLDSATEAAQALDAANRFVTFTYVFPLWYRGRYYAELLGSTRIKFTALGGAQQRRVSAYQKGFRPRGFQPVTESDMQPEKTDLEDAQFRAALSASWPLGPSGFFYPRPFILLTSLYKKYMDRLTASFRRSISLSLGTYSLGEFASFYAAFLAVCSLHDHLCYQWSTQTGIYPVDSGLLVKQRSSWLDICGRLSCLPSKIIDAMITDLSFGTTRPTDLHVHPFVPLSEDSTLLGVAPQFPLNSAPDENILRVCSYIKREAFDIASLGKEEQTRQELGAVIGRRFNWRGPVSLPRPKPDIDLVILDAASSTVLICELKWIRKPLLALEYIRADEEFRKGLKQLSVIQEFLKENPMHLKNCDIVDHPLSAYRHVHYILVARDHFLWNEPRESISVLGFAPFKDMLSHSTDLSKGIRNLLEYNWLPEEGSDFEVRNEYAVSNGVVVDSEIFYPVGAPGISI